MATYAQVVSQAISDFDSIYNALKSKLVTPSNNSTSVLTAEQLNNGTISTSVYATFITNQLFRVGTASNDKTTMSGITPTLVNGVIADYTGVTNSVADGTYGVPTASSIPVTFSIASPGYYDTTSGIVGNVTISNVTLNDSNISSYAVSENNTVSYLIQNANNIPMLSVSMPKGGIGVLYSNTPTITEAISTTLTIDSAGSTVLGATLTQGAGMYTISVKKDANYSATGSITPIVSIDPGFVTSSDVSVATPDFSINTNMSQATETIYVPAGSVSGTISNNATLEISGSPALSLTNVEPNYSYYTLTATASGLSVLATTTAGYIEAGTDVAIGNVANKTATYYIPEGTVSDTTIHLTSSQLTFTDNSSMVSVDPTGHAITYGVTMDPQSTSITPGFVIDSAYTVDVDGTKTIYIKEAAITETTQISVGTITGSGTSVILNNNTGFYKISVPVSANASYTAASSSYGYFDNGQQITNIGDDETLNFSVAQGGVTVTPSLTTALTDRNDSLSGSHSDLQNGAETMFYSQIPETGDYYTITASASATPTPGYITSNDVHVNSDQKFYLKKATFKYVENMDDPEASFLEVTTGGYVPSGTISDIASISGQIDAADVTVSLTDNSAGVITSVTPASGVSYYTISAGKGTVDAGYISSNNGTVTGTGYVLHGEEELTTTINSSTLDASSATLSNGIYTFDVDHSLTNTLSFTEGYIKLADITLNSDDGILTETIARATTITIPEGVYSITSKSFTVEADFNSNIDFGASALDGYAITPKISSGSITVNATTAGYIIPDNEDFTHQFTNSDASISATTYYIKKGTGPALRTGYSSTSDWTTSSTTPVSSNISVSNNFNNNSISGAYTITLGGYVDASLKLDTGYYDAESSTISNGHVNVNRTISIAHGKASVSLTDSNVITLSNGLTSLNSYLQTSAPANGYVTIESTIDIGSALTITEGYIKNIAADKELASITGKVTRAYIATTNVTTSQTAVAGTKLDGTSTVPAGTTIYGALTLGSNNGDISASSSYATTSTSETGLRDAIIIPTANTYALYDTKVILTDDAMGPEVVRQMNRLQSRLSGSLVSAG